MVENTYPRQRADIETHIMPDGTCLLFDVVSNEGRALNQAGALVWDYCDGALSAGEIAAELAALLPNEAHMHAKTLALLDEFEQLGYVTVDKATPESRATTSAGAAE
jgi:coenzyme PQQ synthesis protein D (PqqD)